MNIVLMLNNSEPERVTKDLQTLATLTGSLKDGTSVINPTILLQGTPATIQQIVTSNYLQIPDFGRYYFIRDISSVRTNLWEISCHVDVLQSYATQIKEQTGIVQRQENKWNLYLNDGSFKVYQNPNVLTKPFPNGFKTNEFVIAIAGS